MRNKYLSFIIFLTIITSSSFALKWEKPNFIADTITVTILGDSLVSNKKHSFTIDDRLDSGVILGTQTKKKWRYIPVDQYYILNNPLAQTVDWYISDSSIMNNSKLYIANLTFWYDRNGLFSKGNKLNGYSYLVDSSGQIIRDWQWDFTVKKQKKKNRKRFTPIYWKSCCLSRKLVYQTQSRI